VEDIGAKVPGQCPKPEEQRCANEPEFQRPRHSSDEMTEPERSRDLTGCIERGMVVMTRIVVPWSASAVDLHATRSLRQMRARRSSRRRRGSARRNKRQVALEPARSGEGDWKDRLISPLLDRHPPWHEFVLLAGPSNPGHRATAWSGWVIRRLLELRPTSSASSATGAAE